MGVVRFRNRGLQTALVCFGATLLSVSHQLFCSVNGFLGRRPSGALGTVDFGFFLSSTLIGLPELALQFFRPSE